MGKAFIKDVQLTKLARAGREVMLFVNSNKESNIINRSKKIMRHPLKVADMTLFRSGLSRNPNRRIHMFWGGTLMLPVWDEDAALAYYTGSLGLAELPLVSYFVRTIDSKDVFYDIGANLGLYSGLAEGLGANIHTFEPSERTAPYLKMNAGTSATVNVIAVSDAIGTVSFFEVNEGKKIGMSSLFPDMVPQTTGKKPRMLTVATTTLDEYVKDHTPPTILKIDVMNADYLVLAGAQSVLTKYSPVVALRLYGTPQAVERSEQTLALLYAQGYKAFAIAADGSISPTTVVLKDIGFATTLIFKKS